ncbi:unnamed protein product [Arabidopsis halleri]
MGNKTSRKSKETSARNYTTELRSYEAACKEDMEIQSFDKRMQARTSHVISTLATGVEVRALSFVSLKVVTESLLDMNQEVVKVILDCKKDIWKNQEMLELVEDYFATSLKTLDFCNALGGGLQRVRVSHLLILDGNGYKKTLEELKRFKDTERPFDQDFFKMFQSVYKQQMLMLEKLQLCKNKLDKKLKRIHTWRKVSSIIFMATFATMVICSVVAAAIAAPPVAAALAAAMAPLGSMGKWIDSLWKNYENAIKGQKEGISSMQAGTYVAVKDLDNIRDLIERLDIEIREMVKNAEFAVEHDAVKIGINAIKKKFEVFQKNVEALGIQADICSREIIKARTVILQRIINHPNNSSCST